MNNNNVNVVSDSDSDSRKDNIKNSDNNFFDEEIDEQVKVTIWYKL